MDSARIGRHAEIQALHELLGNTDKQAPGGLVVCGAPGLGKSSLLADVESMAGGFAVLRVRAVEFESRMPFATLHHLLLPRLSLLPTLPMPLRGALEMAFGSRPGNPERFKIGLGVMKLLAAVAPTLCVVDDAHWLDPASAEALAMAASRLSNETVVVVFGARPDHGLAALDELPQLRLGPLSQTGAQRLLSSALPIPLDDRVRDQIIAEARGIPSAIAELVGGVQLPSDMAGGYALPGTIRAPAHLIEEYDARLAELSKATRALVLLAAADPTGDLALLWRAAQSAGIDKSAATNAIDSGLLEISARVSFARPLVRSAIYISADPSDRRAAHRALATATDKRTSPESRAWHRGQSAIPPDAAISRELERNAPTARCRGGVAAAAAFLERSAALAADPPRRFDLALKAAAAKSDAGDLDAAAMLAAAARLDADSGAKNARVDAFQAHIAFTRSCRAYEANQLFSAARNWARQEPGAANTAYLGALVAAYMTGDDHVREHADEDGVGIVGLAPAQADDGPLNDVLSTLAMALSGRQAEVVPLARRSMAALRKHADEPDGFDPAWAWIVCSLAWDDESLDEITERQLAAVRRVGRVAALPVALTSRALVHMHVGELERAAEYVADARQLSQTAPALVELGVTAWRGDRRAVEQLCSRLLGPAPTEADPRQLVGCTYARLVVHNGLGNWAAALSAADGYADRDVPGFHVFVPPELVEAAAHEGRIDLAHSLVERLSEHAMAADTPWALGIERRCRALVSAPASAEQLFVESIHHLRASQTTLQLARTQLLFGEWLRRRQRRGDARAQLRAAFETFSLAGAKQFAKRAARELRAAGESPAQPRGQRGGLTSQEFAIAERVADGKTSKEIAAELVLSPRTVDAHLRNIFSKLGIKSRRQVRDTLPGIRPDTDGGNRVAVPHPARRRSSRPQQARSA